MAVTPSHTDLWSELGQRWQSRVLGGEDGPLTCLSHSAVAQQEAAWTHGKARRDSSHHRARAPTLAPKPRAQGSNTARVPSGA